MFRFVLLISFLVASCAEAAAAPAPLKFKFDTTAVEDFLRAVDRQAMDDAALDAIVARPGAAGMVRNTLKYVPDSPRDGYRASLREIATTGAPMSDPYQVANAVKNAATVRTLLAAVVREQATMAARISARLAPHWKRQAPVIITVRFVVGGVSDGFVLDGDTSAEFFIALDKAGGDLAGLEQNIGHEAVHVLQRQLLLRNCPERGLGENLPVAERFMHDLYFEGVANFIADPADVPGTGEYIDMWRSRYLRNETPQRQRENAWLFDHLLSGLRSGDLSWETAQQIGFYGNTDSRMYFHGRGIARKLQRAGKETLSAEFMCNAGKFFGDPTGK